jgi:hypothetical protein
MRHLATEEMKESTKNHYQKAAKTLFKWKREARNKDVGWEPEIQYSDIDLQVIISGDLSKSRRELHEVRQEIEEQEFKGERYELQLLVESVESAESYGEDLKEIFSEGIKLKETDELEQVTEAVFRG